MGSVGTARRWHSRFWEQTAEERILRFDTQDPSRLQMSDVAGRISLSCGSAERLENRQLSEANARPETRAMQRIAMQHPGRPLQFDVYFEEAPT